MRREPRTIASGRRNLPFQNEVNKMMNNMIDPSDLSVPTIEYLFSQQIMRLTAATVKYQR